MATASWKVTVSVSFEYQRVYQYIKSRANKGVACIVTTAFDKSIGETVRHVSKVYPARPFLMRQILDTRLTRSFWGPARANRISEEGKKSYWISFFQNFKAYVATYISWTMKRNKRIFVWVITIDVFSESERPQIPGLHTIFEMTYSSLIFVIFALILNLRSVYSLHLIEAGFWNLLCQFKN